MVFYHYFRYIGIFVVACDLKSCVNECSIVEATCHYFKLIHDLQNVHNFFEHSFAFFKKVCYNNDKGKCPKTRIISQHLTFSYKGAPNGKTDTKRTTGL